MLIKRDAIFGKQAGNDYRLFLGRYWDDKLPIMGLVMLNPSVANDLEDDPTIRRCISFAQRDGYGSIEVYNLYDLVATNQDVLHATKIKVSAQFDTMINNMGFNKDRFNTVVFACGKPKKGDHRPRIEEVYKIVKAQGFKIRCLGTTQEGYPRHPLYLKKDTRFEAWRPVWT